MKNLSQNGAKYYVLAEIYYTNSSPLPVFFGRTAFQAFEPLGEVLRLLEAQFAGDFIDTQGCGQKQKFRPHESLSLNMLLRGLTGVFADQVTKIIDGEAEAVSAIVNRQRSVVLRLTTLIIFITKPLKTGKNVIAGSLRCGKLAVV